MQPIPLAQWQNNSQLFHFRGHSFRYWTSEDSDKPALLMIHGFPSASWDWSPMWQTLSQDFYLIAVDMLGFGLSCKDPGADYRIFFQADLQQALLKYLEIDQFFLIAHDYGDTVAQELLARDKNDQIKKAVLLNGGLFPETHRALFVQKLLLSPLGKLVPLFINATAFQRSFTKICAQPLSQTELDGLWQLLMTNNGHKVMPKLIGYIHERRQYRDRWVSTLQQAKHKLTLLNGSADPISGRHMVERYRHLISEDNILEFPDLGHYPQLEDPKAICQAIRSSLMTL